MLCGDLPRIWTINDSRVASELQWNLKVFPSFQLQMLSVHNVRWWSCLTVCQRSRLGYLVFNSQASGSMSTDNVTSITVFMYVCIASPFEESGSHARFSGRSAVSADLITTDEAEENVCLLILHRKQAVQENSSTHRGTHNTYTHRMIAGHIGPDHMRYCS